MHQTSAHRILFALCILVFPQISFGFVYPRGSTFGYLAAVVMPLDIPNKNVYFAFNFESNFAFPWNDTHNDLIYKWKLSGMHEGVPNNITAITNRKRSIHEIYNRNNFYGIFTGHLQHIGLNGTGCLLRTICELAEGTLSEYNGLLGSLFDVFFLPSTSSESNKVANIFYEAENQGRAGDCNAFIESCPTEFLDLISEFF